MKDMFYSYDNDISTEDLGSSVLAYSAEADSSILKSNNHLVLVTDLMGRELGIRAKADTAFDLFFILDGWVEGNSIEELVLHSSVSFQLIDCWHHTVMAKDLAAEECYVGDNTIKISINPADLADLKSDSYQMKVSLIWPGGAYTLYSEDKGLLTIK